ncbi:isoprenylcysteine carboxyl methyltransferase family protein [Camelliibacillus cellulosilyticus]|uniref:Isoprenylcysteine carboxyl methyltransferase family protein n=1 Tax=Camelliibacillus cellulosilyticus TaxID=2174486 RepID=A0ABV9GLL9_9BACL
MIFFIVLILFVACQRMVELVIAKRNERRLRAMGAYEIGGEHYKWIVLLHALFLFVLISEVLLFHKKPAPWFWIPFGVFLIAQVARVWAIMSLGLFWNTKIIILPGADVVARGPYRYVRHPNYLIVFLEILTLPLIFQAYFTAILFTLLNAVFIIGVRVPDEEKALFEVTNYRERMAHKHRFIPRPPRKT